MRCDRFVQSSNVGVGERGSVRGYRCYNCKQLGVAYTSRACTAELGGFAGVMGASIGVRAGPKRATIQKTRRALF